MPNSLYLWVCVTWSSTGRKCTQTHISLGRSLSAWSHRGACLDVHVGEVIPLKSALSPAQGDRMKWDLFPYSSACLSSFSFLLTLVHISSSSPSKSVLLPFVSTQSLPFFPHCHNQLSIDVLLTFLWASLKRTVMCTKQTHTIGIH